MPARGDSVQFQYGKLPILVADEPPQIAETTAGRQTSQRTHSIQQTAGLLNWVLFPGPAIGNKSFQPVWHLVQELLIGSPVQQDITTPGLKEGIFRVLHGKRIGLKKMVAVGHLAQSHFHPHGDSLSGPSALFDRSRADCRVARKPSRRASDGIPRFMEYCGGGRLHLRQQAAPKLDRCAIHAAGLSGGRAAEKAHSTKCQ